VDTHEEKILAQSLGRSTYCPNPAGAVALKIALAIVLHDNPPTVLVSGQRLCSRNRNSSCDLIAEAIVQEGINSPDFPGEVYQA
jgi:hypothetical protein